MSRGRAQESVFLKSSQVIWTACRIRGLLVGLSSFYRPFIARSSRNAFKFSGVHTSVSMMPSIIHRTPEYFLDSAGTRSHLLLSFHLLLPSQQNWDPVTKARPWDLTAFCPLSSDSYSGLASAPIQWLPWAPQMFPVPGVPWPSSVPRPHHTCSLLSSEPVPSCLAPRTHTFVYAIQCSHNPANIYQAPTRARHHPRNSEVISRLSRSCYSKGGHRPAALALPAIPWEIQILRPHPRLTGNQNLIWEIKNKISKTKVVF